MQYSYVAEHVLILTKKCFEEVVGVSSNTDVSEWLKNLADASDTVGLKPRQLVLLECDIYQ